MRADALKIFVLTAMGVGLAPAAGAQLDTRPVGATVEKVVPSPHAALIVVDV